MSLTRYSVPVLTFAGLFCFFSPGWPSVWSARCSGGPRTKRRAASAQKYPTTISGCAKSQIPKSSNTSSGSILTLRPWPNGLKPFEDALYNEMLSDVKQTLLGCASPAR